MPGKRQIYEIAWTQPIGPWKDRSGPGLIVTSATGGPDDPYVVVPMSSAEPRGAHRHVSVLLDEDVLGLTVPIWIHTSYPTTVPGSMLQGIPRALCPLDKFELVCSKLKTVMSWRA